MALAVAVPICPCPAVMPVPPQIEIRGLKPSYRVNAPIPFTVVKHMQGEVAIACAAEMYIDGHWQETRWDIFSPADKELSWSRSHSIRAEASEMVWDVPHIKPNLRPKVGRSYRLRIDVLRPKGESIVSAAFSIDE